MSLPEAEVQPAETGTSDPAARIAAHEGRNLLTLAAHMILMRTAWIFKTETVIMPTFVDAIAGEAWVRGCLPVLNGLGQALPPLFFAERLRGVRHKKYSLIATAATLSVPFLTLSALWYALGIGPELRPAPDWLPPLFLVLYFLFFSTVGMHHVAAGTVQGKLIAAERRGRLLSLSGMVGSVTAITAAWLLMRRWLDQPGGGFIWIFATTGFGFVTASSVVWLVDEPPDESDGPRLRASRVLHGVWEILRTDRDFRRLMVVAMLFVTIQLLFPHYSWLGRHRADYRDGHLMIWVCAQNAGTGLFSLLAGSIADRFGNRLTLRIAIACVAAPPLAAILISSPWLADQSGIYWIVFFLLGWVPVTFKTFVNYTLEIARPGAHPRYLSTLRLLMLVPIGLAPLIGLLVDALRGRFGDFPAFAVVFLGVACLILTGSLLTFRLTEPRHQSGLDSEVEEAWS